MDLAAPGRAQLPQADAVVVALTADTRTAESYERAYRSTLRGLAAALPEPPRRVVFVSSTSVLGERPGEAVTEETVPRPARDTVRVLLHAEHDARELFDEVVVLRPAGIYGPGRTGTIDRVVNGSPADHRRTTNRIHRDDLVTGIVAAVEATDPPGLLHGSDAEPAPLGEVLQYLAERLGVPVPPHAASAAPGGKSIDGSRLHRLIGRLAYPTYREGYADLLERRRA